MNPKPTIYFDLDDTVYDLYHRMLWLDRITILADPSVYEEKDANIYARDEFIALLDALVAAGYKLGVVSWLAKGGTQDYNNAVREVKRAWVKAFMPQVTEIHIVKYGTPKHHVINDKGNAILVDDVEEVRAAWHHGHTIDASDNIIPALIALMSE